MIYRSWELAGVVCNQIRRGLNDKRQELIGNKFK